jgi:hypothetical protein
MAYADFHVHGNFKTFYSAYDVDQKASPWESVEMKIEKVIWKREIEFSAPSLASTQLDEGNLELGSNAL